MSDMSEVGVAAVRIIPVLKGFSAAISKQLGAEMGRAAKRAGDDAGDALADGLSKATKKAAKKAGDDFASAAKSWPAPKWPDWPPPQVAQTMESEFRDVREAARKTMAEVAKQLRVDGRVKIDTREIEMAKAALRDLNSIPAPSIDIKVDASAAKKAGDEAGDAIADGIEDGVDSGSGRLRGAADRVGDIFKKTLAAAALAAGALLVTGVAGALEQGAILDKFEASLGGGGDFAARMGEIAGDLYLEGFGDSIADTGDVVRRVWQGGLLPEDATDDQIERLSTKILTFTDVMTQDMDMTTQAVASMIKSGIADSSEEALDILTAGLQQGADKAGDLLETFQEYSGAFDTIGISAEDATGLMIQGLGAGARDADKVADALKEIGIRAKNGSEASAEGFRLLSLNADEMTAKFAAGGDAAREGLDQVLDGLREIEDPAQRNAAAVALFGTQAEDLGDALFALDLDTAATHLGDFAGATDELGSAYDNASSKINIFKRKALDKLITFVGGTAIPFIERLAAVVGPVFTAVIDQVSSFWAALTTGDVGEGSGVEDFALGLRDAFSWVPGVIDDLELFWGALTTGESGGTAIETVALAIRDFGDYLSENQELIVGALVGIGVAVGVIAAGLIIMAASSAVAAAPFLLLVAAAAALGAGLVWLYNNVEGFRTLVETAWPIIQDIFTTALAVIAEVVAVTVETLTYIWDTWGTQIVAIATAAWEMVSGVIIGALNIIAGVINLVLALIEGDWAGAWEAIKQIVTGAWQVIWSIVSNALQIIWNLVVIWLGAVLSFWGSILGGLVNTARSKLDAVVAFFRSLPGRIRTAFAGLASAITSPFRSAFNAIKSLWNRTVGGFRISIPGFLGFGGINFSIPSMHTGGIVPGPIGSEQLINAQAGETVFTRDQMAAINSAPGVAAPAASQSLDVNVNGTDRELVRLVQKWVRNNAGGDAQLGLGTRRSTRTA